MRCHLLARALVRSSAILLIMGIPAALQGQDQGQDLVVPTSNTMRGLQIYSVSAYSVYYSSGFPDSYTFQTGTGTFGSDMGLGASARIGWQRTGEKSTYSFLYMPSYTGRVRYAAWNFLNHSLSFTGSRKIARRWTLGFSTAGNVSNLAETFFSPTVFSNLASVPASFPDLAAAVLAGQFSSAQLAAALTGAPLIEAPGRNVFYGDRILMAGADTTLSYSYSPRLTIRLAARGNRSQYLSDSANMSASQSLYVIPSTTSAGADVDVAYSLSPRTQIGVSVGSNRIVSDLVDSYVTSSTASVGRTMGIHWFLQVHGGVSTVTPVRQMILLPAGSLPSGPQPTGGGSLGFRTFSHTFLGSYDHSASDSYGYGANSTESISGSWNWRRPGRSWWVECGLSEQRMEGNSAAYGNISSWRVTGGWGKLIGTQKALLAQYVYMRYSGVLQNTPFNASQSAVRFTISWSPRPGLL
jgi:hypothetical protein